MRYLIDTNIFIYISTDVESLSKDVQAIVFDYDSNLCISAESVRELIVAYSKRRFDTRQWKSALEMVRAITYTYQIDILPVDKYVMETYASLDKNDGQEHNDPSDHVIISHALALKMPLISSDHKFSYYVRQGLDLIYNEK